MTRTFAILTLFVLAGSLPAGGDAVKKTIVYIQKLQTDSGGFRANEPKADINVLPTLRATSSAIRALKYWEGDLPNKDKCVKFVESCWDAEVGAFADQPKGIPDVFTTAVGLMAVVELKMPADKYVDAATTYLNTHAKTFEEIRIAAAGFEPVNKKSARAADWMDEVEKLWNKKDGPFNTKGPGMARDLASVFVTKLRLSGERKFRDPVVNDLDQGQRKNGGWGKADSEIASDLETTYRVVRCYAMLKHPMGNREAVRSFVAKCRNSDGGYAVVPGQPSSVSGTYFAGIVLHWVRENPK